MPFEQGQDFPGATHRTRYGNYARWRFVLRGDHALAWTARQAIASWSGTDYGSNAVAKKKIEELDSQLSVVVNLPRVIERKFASLMIRGIRLAGPKGDTGAQEAVDEVIKASGGLPTLHRCAFRMCGYGNAIVSISRGDYGVRFNARDPWTWFPEVDKADGSRVDRHVFAWRQNVGDLVYLMQEIHTAGMIERVANALHGVKGDEKVGKPQTWEALGFDPAIYKPVERTGVDEPLVAVWSNVTDEESVYGDSDLQGNEPMAAEVTSRVSQISGILDRHADPKLTGPARAVRRDVTAGEPVAEISGSRFLPRQGADEAPYEYLTWDAQLGQAFDHLKSAIRLLCLQMEMAPALLGLEEGAGVESSNALRIRAVNTVDAVENKRMFSSVGIQAAVRLALELGGKKDVLPSVSFGDVLPLTRTELADSVAKERLGGLLSREAAIKRLNPDLSEEDVALEIERIQGEEAGVMNPGTA